MQCSHDNSIVFFPSNAFHEVRPVQCPGNDPDDYRFTVNGWFHAAPTADDIVAVDHLTNAQRQTIPHFTDNGFEILDTPPARQRRLADAWLRTRDQPMPELADGRLYQAGLPDQTTVDFDQDELLAELLAEHEAWAGVELEATAMFGFRLFRTGQTQRPHTLRAESHVITSIFCIDVDGAEDQPAQNWPMYLVDHHGTEHELALQPGHLRGQASVLFQCLAMLFRVHGLSFLWSVWVAHINQYPRLWPVQSSD